MFGPTIDIEDRRQYAREALDAYRAIHPDYHDEEGNRDEEPDEQAVTDLISDLLHLLRDLGIEDPENALTMAAIHFNTEESEEKEGEE